MKIENVEYCMNLHNVHLSNESPVIVISSIYRYHLCGNLKFDEFPPGVSLVCFFLCMILCSNVLFLNFTTNMACCGSGKTIHKAVNKTNVHIS